MTDSNFYPKFGLTLPESLRKKQTKHDLRSITMDGRRWTPASEQQLCRHSQAELKI